MTYQAMPAKSIREAGEEFHSELIRHFENDRPDVNCEDYWDKETRSVSTVGKD